MQQDLQRRSEKGQLAEEDFLNLMLSKGKLVYPFQWGKDSASIFYLPNCKKAPTPDFMVIDPFSMHNEFHETKSKYPTYSGCFGMETYRFEALMELVNNGLSVWYTLKMVSNGDEKGKRFINQIKLKEGDWITAPVKKLNNNWTETSTAPGFCRGKFCKSLPIYYFDYKLFSML